MVRTDCPGCLEKLVDPRTLSCGHVYCLGCLEMLQTKKQRVQCHICYSISSVILDTVDGKKFKKRQKKHQREQLRQLRERRRQRQQQRKTETTEKRKKTTKTSETKNPEQKEDDIDSDDDDTTDTENFVIEKFNFKSNCPKCVLPRAKVKCPQCKFSNFCSQKCVDEHRGSDRCKASEKVNEIFQNAKKAENTAKLCREKLTLLVIKFDPKGCHFCRNIIELRDLKLCAGCATAKYCSKNCQIKDWAPEHKEQCLEMRHLREKVFNLEEKYISFEQGFETTTKLDNETNVKVKSTGRIEVSTEQMEHWGFS